MRRGLLSLLAAGFLFTAAGACGKKFAPPTTPPEEQKPALETTGAAQALSRVTADPIAEEWARLSPDKSTLLFHTHNSQPQGGTRLAIVGVDPNTGARRTVYTKPNASSGFPSWMPDGSTYVYMTTGMGSQSIVRALSSSPNAGVSVAVSGNVAPEPIHPSVSPDGQRVAFRTYMSGDYQIAVSGLDGSKLTILAPGNSPSWHPDGTRLVFSRNVSGYDQLFTINAESGADLTQLTNEQANARFPSFSPDGRHIVFVSDRTGKQDLFAIRPDGTVLTALTQGLASSTTPSWEHDGYIYFSSDAGGNWDIWRFQPVGELALQMGAVPSPTPPVTQPPSTQPPSTQPPAAGGCQKDTDCKGDRICKAGACVDPSM